MQKWEYRIIASPKNIGTDIGSKLEKLEIVFNEGFGSEGWELVSVNNGVAYFKRPLKNVSNMVIRKYDTDGNLAP